MGAPQIVLIVLIALNFGCALAKNEDVGVTTISIAIISSILWWGGFWG